MPRLAGWEIGRVPGFYHNTGAPGVATLEAGDYLKDDYYINDTGPALYVCTTAGSASTSVWSQPTTAASVGIAATVWTQIQTHDTAGAAETSFTWTVVGDTDIEYRIIARVLANAAGYVGLQFNADTGTNYTSEATYGQSGTNANIDATGLVLARIGFLNGAGDVAYTEASFYAKSGNSALRTINALSGVQGSTRIIMALSSGWTGTVAITSITVLSSLASGLGIGSHFELWAPKAVHVVSVP